MVVPENLLYAKTHEWVEIDGGKARVGLTDYAQDALGDIVFLVLPREGAEARAGEAVGEVESVKAVSEVCAPVGGKIYAVNAALNDSPEQINTDPYGAWIFEMDGAEMDGGLLTPEQYAEFCAGESH